MATIIQSGPNKGYYQIPDTLSSEKGPSFTASSSYGASFGQPNLYLAMREQQLALENAAGSGNNVFYRYSPGPNRDIVELNNKPPFIDGYYYVRRNESIDLRKQLYALETNRVPSSGNTEIFNTKLEDIKVPDDYCPYYIDPCPPQTEWCIRCKQPKNVMHTGVELSVINFIMRWLILFIFVIMVSGIIYVAIR